MRRALVLALLAAVGCAGPAPAHSVMKVESGTIHYTANDDVSLNDLSITLQGSDLRFLDRGADGGITPASECSGGAVDADGNIVEVTCPRTGITTVRVDVGEAQDAVTARVPLAMLVLGGPGADAITTGDAGDALNGGAGNDTLRGGGGDDRLVGDLGDDQLFGEDGADTLQGALGADAVDGGPGDDEVRVRDGVRDAVACGDGDDAAQADSADALDGCEAVDRLEGGPATGDGASLPRDTTPPRVRAGGSTSQRVGRTGRVTVMATASEAGELVAAGFVTVGDRRFTLRAARARVEVGGAGARLRLEPGRRAARLLWRLLRSRRSAHATISVVATDTAGNSASARLRRITLRR